MVVSPHNSTRQLSRVRRPKPSIALSLENPTPVDAGVSDNEQEDAIHLLINFLRLGTVPACSVPRGAVFSLSVFRESMASPTRTVYD
jgi:hypothetical protein